MGGYGAKTPRRRSAIALRDPILLGLRLEAIKT
jgi:hypothetical protein